MNRDYTADGYGNPAYPGTSRYFSGGDALPIVMGAGTVRRLAREIADSIIADARHIEGPVVWITGNSYMPPLRSISAAEYVWNAANNADGELFDWLNELVEDRLNAASVLLECPEYDNALYAVDLRRWQYREDAEGDDLNDEWEPADPDAVDDWAARPQPILLDGCTCGGIGSTGSHRPGCIWSAR